MPVGRGGAIAGTVLPFVVAADDEPTAQVVIDPEGMPTEIWERVREHYADDRLIEILVTIGAYIKVSTCCTPRARSGKRPLLPRCERSCVVHTTRGLRQVPTTSAPSFVIKVRARVADLVANG